MTTLHDHGVPHATIHNGITMASVRGGGHVNDMLTSDWLLSSFVFWDNVGVDVAWVRYHLECFLSARKCVLSSKTRFLFFFSWNVVLSFPDAAVVKVFYWSVIIRQINKFVH